ncbi:MAG: 3',5'-cyclic-AMP phosphodiesterase [Gammaproteobacteria bacterium]|nr:MAG: 3',5'-cyclic-AMP phosphodiesterase [Gammaproteobacteria bacterium]RLA21695.1 MAG: 3',5'-cyclic-AMP phosphodiesterase [Gammaproteobacteria bacterium]
MAVSQEKHSGEGFSKDNNGLNIVQLTDLHLFADPESRLLGIQTEESFLSVLELAQKQHAKPDLMLFTGDLTQDASAAAYQRLQDYLSKLDIPCYCLPGNHDDPELMRSLLNFNNIKTSSSILQKKWQIICLNSKLPGSEGGHLAAKELKLLKQSLKSHPDKPTLIVLHHPPLPVGSPWLDTMTLDNPDALFEIIHQNPQVKGLLVGHVHQDQDWQQNGVRLLTTPSTCFQFKPNSRDFALDQQPPGYRWLSLHQNGSIETGISRLASMPEGLNNGSLGY